MTPTEAPSGGAARMGALWDRAEALVAAWLEGYWQPDPEAESDEPRPSAPLDPLYPPGVDRPPRAGPDLKELSAAIICLRRIQDARLILERGATAEGGDSPDADEGNGIDLAVLNATVSRILGAGPAAPPKDLDEDALRDGHAAVQ